MVSGLLSPMNTSNKAQTAVQVFQKSSDIAVVESLAPMTPDAGQRFRTQDQTAELRNQFHQRSVKFLALHRAAIVRAGRQEYFVAPERHRPGVTEIRIEHDPPTQWRRPSLHAPGAEASAPQQSDHLDRPCDPGQEGL